MCWYWGYVMGVCVFCVFVMVFGECYIFGVLVFLEMELGLGSGGDVIMMVGFLEKLRCC